MTFRNDPQGYGLFPNARRRSPRSPTGCPGRRALFFLGVTSYSVYVLHMPLINTSAFSAPLKLALAYGVAIAVFVWFERPLFRLRTA